MNQAEARKNQRTLNRKLRVSWLFLLTERIVRAFWPVAVSVLIWLAAFKIGAAIELMLVAMFAVPATLGFGFSRLVIPDREDARARLDQGHRDRPFAALSDTQVLGDAAGSSAALWQLHQDRMRAQALRISSRAPDFHLQGKDVYGLRLIALVAAVASLIFWRPDHAVQSTQGAGQTAVAGGPAWEGWITPPAYTGHNVIYLPEVEPEVALTVPVGSAIRFQLYSGELSVAQSVSDDASGPVPGPGEVSIVLANDGEVTLQPLGLEWAIAAKPDEPPQIAFAGEVSAGRDGAARVPFSASDDYGIAQASVRISLDFLALDRRYGLAPDPVDREPMISELPLPFARDLREVEETFTENFSKHPWSGLPVEITLRALDDLDQMAEASVQMLLPGRRFYDPLAAAIVEMRRDLLWSPENDDRVLHLFRAATYPAEQLGLASSTWLILRTTLHRFEYALEGGVSEAERADVAEAMWLAALAIEDGTLGSAAERLRQTQERLLEAIARDAPPDEIARLMEEMREAMQEYMRQLAERAQQMPPEQLAEDSGQTFTMQDIQELMDQIEQLLRDGQTADAQQLLEMLQQMMENMQLTMRPGQQGESMSRELMDSLRQQQELSDDTFDELQRRFGQNREGQPISPGDLADRQEALRRFIEEMQQGGTDPGMESLGRAQENMGDAADALERGDFSSALDDQAEAMDALRDSLREMQEAQNEANSQEGRGQGQPESRDPLGRPAGAQGRVDSGDTAIPDANASERARELMEEIRRRAGELERPEEERDYLQRLLERF